MKYSLELVVFLCGASIMVLELVGSRLLAPFVGTSIVVWTSLIGIVLAALSIGYSYGGRLADRRPDAKLLSWIIFAAAVFISLISGIKLILFGAMEGNSLDHGTQAVIISIILFGTPSVLLGMVSPFAAKLKTESVQKVGGTIGNLYALSTIGSIVGTFLSGFYLIATFPISQIIIGISLILFVCSIILYKHSIRDILIKVIILLGVLLIAFFLEDILSNRHVLTVNTQYNNVSLYETNFYQNQRPIRVMSLDGKLDSAMYMDSDELVFDYTKYYRLANAYNSNIKNILVIGGAGYSVPKDFLRNGVAVDVVEIDPELTKLAQKYFDPHGELKNNNLLTIYHEDGRTFLNKNTKKQYDVIMLDAFKSYSIPYQLTTIEAVQKMKGLLKPNGIVMANVISAVQGDKGQFLQAEYHTFKQSFSQVDLYIVNIPTAGESVQNLMLIGGSSQSDKPVDPEVAEYLSHQWTQIVPQKQILTDDYAPVDQLMLPTML
jgi:spermidine synthase